MSAVSVYSQSAKGAQRVVRPAAFITAFLLMLGGVISGQFAAAPPAQAASTQGNASSFNTAGWRYIAGGATPTPVQLGATIAAGSAVVPFTPIDRTHLYGSSYNNGGTVWYIDPNQPISPAHQVLIGYGKNAGNIQSNPLSTIAIDADPYGTRAQKTAYLWGWDSGGAPTQAENGGQPVPANTSTVIRWKENSTDGEFILIPDPNYFTGPQQGLAYQYWSGGEVIQKTGEIFMGGGECTTINGGYNMMIFNPETFAYNFSGQILPLTPADNIFPNTTGTTCGGPGYVASDFALDANGNAYLQVVSNQAAPDFGLTTAATRMWLVRVIPATNGGSWHYELVTPFQAAPGQAPVAAAYAGGGNYNYGSAFFNGMLYVAQYQNGDTMLQINPMSGLVYSLPLGSATSDTFGPVQNYVQDLASGQTAQVLEGTVYNDANSNGLIDAGETGVANVKVALYLKNASGQYVLEGTRQTNSSGNYSFLLGGDGDYIVRVAEPQINGVNAVQTWASGDSPAPINNSSVTITAVCASGNVTGAGGGACNGAHPMPFPDPAVPTGLAALGTDTSTQPDAMAIYSMISITGDQIVGNANFGITALGSFGDSSVPPTTIATGAPVHINGVDPNRLYLGNENGQKYTAPATDNAAHNATDDGVTLKSALGRIPLQGTMLAGTKAYTLTSPVNGTDAAKPTVLANGWSTAPNGNAWVTTAAWQPTISAGVASGTFQPVSTGTSLGATGQNMYFRAQVSETATTLPTNTSYQYQAQVGSATQPWATPGEIEDYSFQVADAVYRVAAQTTAGTGTFTIDGKPIQVVTPATWTFGPAAAVAVNAEKTITTTPPTGWDVDSVQLLDTETGAAVTTDNLTVSTTGGVTTIKFTPKLGEDLTVGVIYAMAANATNSTLVMSPLKTATDPQSATAQVNQPITAKVTVKADDGTLLPGKTVTFNNASAPTTVLDNGLGGKTCVTSNVAGPDYGTCSVTITSATAGTYTNEVSATVKIGGTDTAVSGSPATVTFIHGPIDYSLSRFSVTPVTDPADANKTNWPVADGTAYYTGNVYLRDTQGNPITDQDLTTIVFAASSANITISSPVVNAGGGNYTVHFTTKVASAAYTASVTAGGTPVTTDGVATHTTLPIPFKAGPITPNCTDPTNTGKPGTSLTATPSSLQAGGNSTVKAYLTDANCNPVGGASVTFTKTLSATFVGGTATCITNNVETDPLYGSCTVQVTDNIAETTSVGASATTTSEPTPVALTPVNVTFTHAPIDYTASRFTVAPTANLADNTTWVVADGTAHYTGTLTVVDTSPAHNPITDLTAADVVWANSSTNVILGTPVNNGDGTYTITFASKVAEPAKTGDPVPLASVKVQGTSVTYDGTATHTTLPTPFKPGPWTDTCTDPTGQNRPPSSISAAPASLPISELSTIKVHLADINCNPVVGEPVTIALNGTYPNAILTVTQPTTDDNGDAFATLTDTTVQAVQVSGKAMKGTPAVLTGVPGSPVTVTFTEGGFSWTLSTFAVSPVADPADTTNKTNWVEVDNTGTKYYTGTLTARDTGGNLLSNLTLTDIQFAATGTVTITSVVNAGNGLYTVHYSSTVAAPSAAVPATPMASVTYKGTQVGTDKPIPFAPGAPGPCTDPTKDPWSLTASPTSLKVNTNSTVTAYITDEFCNAAKDGSVVTFAATPTGTMTLTPVNGGKTTNGFATATLTDSKAEAVTVTATAAGTAVPPASGVVVTFTAGPISYEKSTFTVTPVADPADTTHTNWVKADNTGTYYYTGTLMIVDQDNNALDSYDLTAIKFQSSSADVAITSVQNIGGGKYTVKFSSTVADPTPTAWVTVNGTKVGPQPAGTVLPIPFRAGDPGPCEEPTKPGWSLSATPTALQVDALATATAYITDKYCNPAEVGTEVTFNVTKSGKLSPTGTTWTPSTLIATVDTTGHAVIKVTDSTNETVTLTASALVAGTPTAVPPAAGVNIKFGHGIVDPNNSSIAVSPNEQKVSSIVKVTITLKDAQLNPIDDLVASDFVTAGTSAGLPNATLTNWSNLGGGVYTYDATSYKVGLFTFASTVTGIALNPNHPADQAKFTPGDICVTNCQGEATRFVVSQNNAFANGTAKNEVTAYAFDTWGNPVPNASFTLTDQTGAPLNNALTPQGSATPAPTYTGTTLDDGTGSAKATYTTLKAGTYTLTGTFQGATGPLTPSVGATLTMTFNPTDAVGGDLTLNAGPYTAGDSATATVSAKDSQGNLVGGATITLATSSANVTLNNLAAPQSCQTSTVAGPTFGTCTVQVSSKLIGNYTVSATVGGVRLNNSPAPISFVAGQVCFTACTPVDNPDTPGIDESKDNFTHVKLTQDSALDNNTAQNKVTAYAYDQYGNPVQNAVVTSTAVTPTLTVVAPGTTTTPAYTGSNGTVAVGYTSGVPGTATANMLINGTAPNSPLGSSPVTMTFSGGLGDPAHSSVTIAPNNGTNLSVGTAQPVDTNFTITAKVNDSTDNPVAGAVVKFTADQGANLNGAGTATQCMTGDGTAGTVLGQCQVQVTSTKAGTYYIGATIPNSAMIDTPLVGSRVSATFTAGPICIPNPGPCTPDPGVPTTGITMTTNDVKPDSSTRDVAQVTAYDKHGNPIKDVQFLVTSSDPITILAIDPTSDQGTSQVYFTSGTAGSFHATAKVGTQEVPGSPVNVRFGTGDFDHGTLTVTPMITGTPTPLTVGDQNINTYQVTVTLYDAANGPAKNVGVNFSISPASGPTWTSGTYCDTGATGTCSVYIYSTKSGSYQVSAIVASKPVGTAQPVTWKADAVCSVDAGCTPKPGVDADHQTKVWLTTNDQIANGNAQDIATVRANDQWGNAVGGVMVRATALDPANLNVQTGIAGTDPDTGLTTIWFTTLKAGTYQVHITADTDNKEIPGGHNLSMNFKAGPPVAANSTLSVSPTTATVGGSVTATATVKDANNNLVSGTIVTFNTTLSGVPTPKTCPAGDGTNGTQLGVCSVQISDAVAETTVVTATIPTATGDALITPTAGIPVQFTFGDVDPAHSTLSVAPSSQTAGSPVTVTVVAHDSSDTPITNLTPDQFAVTAAASGLPGLTVTGFTQLTPGVYTAQTTSKLAGTFTFTGVVAGKTLLQHPTATFVAGGVCVSNATPVNPANITRFTVEADNALANNSAKDTVKAWAYDCFGNAVENATVVLTDQTTTAGLVGKLAQATANPVKTGAAGTVLIDFTAGAAGAYSLRGEIDGLRPADTTVVTLNFVPGTVSAYQSTMVLDKATATVGDPITVTITTKDANGSLVGGVSVGLSSTPVGVTFSTACTTSNVENSAAFGTCQVPFTSKLAKTYQINGVIAGTPIGGGGDPAKASPQQATFTADTVCYVDCTPVDDPTTPDNEAATNFTHVSVTKDGALDSGTAQDIVTAYAYDVFGNAVKDATVVATPMATTLTVVAPGTAASPAKTNSSGQAQIAFTSRTAGAVQSHVTIDGVEPSHASGPSPVTMHFAGGIGDPAHSTVTITPNNGTTTNVGTSQPVDSRFTITATVKDSTDNLVEAAYVTLTPPAGLTMTNAAGAPVTGCTTGALGTPTAGTCQVFVTAKIANTYTVPATIPNASGQDTPVIGSPVTAPFVAGKICVAPATPDPGVPVTGVVMTVNGQPADNATPNVATVSAYDCHGNPVEKAPVTSAPGTGETHLTVQTVPPIAPTSSLGQTTISYYSDQNGDRVATVSVGNAATGIWTGTIVMQFGEGNGVAANSSFTVTPKVAGQTTPLTVGTADANTYQVTATVKDAFLKAAPNNVVTFGITPTGSAWVNGQNTCRTDNNGVCSVYLTSTVAGTYAVTAMLGADPIQQAKPAAWKADAICAADCTPVDPNTPIEKRTRFEVVTDNQVADGNHADQIKVYGFDQYGNAVQGAMISSLPATGEETLLIGPSAGTNGSGEALINYTTRVAGTHNAVLYADGTHPIANAAGVRNAALAFKAGAGNAYRSTLDVVTHTSPAGTPVIATATIVDSNGNLVPNATVTFTVDKSGTLTPQTVFRALGMDSTCTTGDGTGAMPLGVCQMSVNDLVAETVSVTATIKVAGVDTPLGGNGDPAHASPQSIEFTLACLPGVDPGCTYDGSVDNAHRTRVNVITNDQVAGTGTDVAKVWVFDKYGNAAGSKTITTTGASPLVTPPAQTTATSGTDKGTTLLNYTTGTYKDQLTTTAVVLLEGNPLVFQPQPGSSLDNPAGIAANSSPISLHFIDTTVPAAPAITSPTDGAKSNQNPLPLTGTGEPGATVTVSSDGQPVLCSPAPVVVNLAGQWSCSAPLPDGQHTLTAIQTDPSNNPSAPSGPVKVTVDTKAPNVPVITETDKNGIAGTVPTSPNPLDPGTTVTITYPKSDGTTGTIPDVPVDPTGHWSVTLPADAVTGTVTASAKDPANNTSAPATAHMDLDPPGAPTITTANATVIAGLADPTTSAVGDTVEVKDKNNQVLCTTQVVAGPNGTLTWSCATPADAKGATHPSDGPITATVTDSNHNTSAKGNGTLDTIPPLAPVVTAPQDNKPLGDNTPTVTGRGEPNAKLVVSDASGQILCETTVSATGTWECTVPEALKLPDGPDKLVVNQTDSAKNVSPDTVVTPLVDTTAPNTPTVTQANKAGIKGTVPTGPNPLDPGTVVVITYPTATGTNTIEVPVDGQGNWLLVPTPTDAIDGNLMVQAKDPAQNLSQPKTVPLDVTDPADPIIKTANKEQGITGQAEAGAKVIITYMTPGPNSTQKTVEVPVDGQGNWKLDPLPSDIADGTITAQTVDPAGNKSHIVTGNLDRKAPEPPVVNDTNGSLITGKGEAGATIEITTKDGTPVVCKEGKVTVDAIKGTFTCTPVTPLTPGTEIKVTAKDPAGNVSDPTTVTVAQLEIQVAKDKLNRGETQTVTGKHFNPGENVCVKIDGQPFMVNGAPLCRNALDDGSVTMTFPIPNDYPLGSHTITVYGPSGSASVGFTVTEAPAIPTGGTVAPAGWTGLYGIIAMLVAGTAGVWLGATRLRKTA